MSTPKKRFKRKTIKELKAYSVIAVVAVALFSAVCIVTMVQLRSIDTNAARFAPVSVQKAAPAVMVEAKTVVPDPCLSAMNEADRNLVLMKNVTVKYNAKIKALKTGDLHLIHKATRDLRYATGALTDQIDKYSAARQLCVKNN